MDIHPTLWTRIIASLLGESDLHHFAVYYDHVIMAGFVFLILLVMSFLIKSRLSLIPGGFQQAIEVTLEALLKMLDENIGHDGRKYLPLVGSLAFFIFLANFMGMVPSFGPATGNLNTTLACAVIVFVYYNYQGFKEHGLAYFKQFMGPSPVVAPLLFVIEMISHFVRPMSLSIRLFGNIGGEHLVTFIFYTQIFAWLVPMPIMVLGLFAAVLQTFVFIMLTQVYIAGAISHDH